MNSPAHIDPEQVLRFAQALDKFATRVANHDQNVASRMARLGASFRDQDYVAFRERFLHSRKLLQKFTVEAKKHVSMLKTDVSAIQSSQRINLDR